MRRVLIDTIPNALVGGVVTMPGPASVSEIVLHFEGTNKAGQTADLAGDLGGPLIIGHHGGLNLGDLVSLTQPQHLLTWWEAFRGWWYELSVQEGAFSSDLIIPFHIANDHNVLIVSPGERLQIEVPPINEAADELDNCVCRVSAVLDNGVSRYIPRIHDMRVDLGGARVERLPEGTAVMILSAGDTTNPASLAVLRGEQRLVYGDWDSLYANWQTLMHAEAEPTVAGDVVIDFTSMGEDLSDATGTGQTLELIDGSDWLTLMTYSLDYHVASKTRESMQVVKRALAEAKARIIRSGISAPQASVVIPPGPAPPQVAVRPTSVPRPEASGAARLGG